MFITILLILLTMPEKGIKWYYRKLYQYVGELMRIIGGKARGTKLYTLEGTITRPTLDRVKESIFNIIQNDIKGSIFLDLFSGSGAIGLESVSRGAQKAILCDKSKKAISIIKKNIEKTHLTEQIEVYNMDFEECIKKIKNNLDIIYIDPPYQTNYIQKSLQILQNSIFVTEKTKIILETNSEERILEETKDLKFEIIDKRKYGIAHIIFLQKMPEQERRHVGT